MPFYNISFHNTNMDPQHTEVYAPFLYVSCLAD